MPGPKGGLDEIAHRRSPEWEAASFLLRLLLIIIIIILATSDAKSQVSKQPHPCCWQAHAGTYGVSCCPQTAGVTMMGMEDGSSRQILPWGWCSSEISSLECGQPGKVVGYYSLDDVTFDSKGILNMELRLTLSCSSRLSGWA